MTEDRSPTELPPDQRNRDPFFGQFGPDNPYRFRDVIRIFLFAALIGLVLIALVWGLATGAVPGDPLRSVRPISDEEVRELIGAVPADDLFGTVQVREVDSNGPAAAAGLILGDVLLTVDGVQVTDADQVKRLLVGYAAGDMVTVTFERGPISGETTITVGEFASPRP